MTIAELKGYIEIETNVPSAAQKLSYNGQELHDGLKTLLQCDIAEDSMLGMHVRNPQAPAAGAGRPVRAQIRRPAQAGAGQGARGAPGPSHGDPEYIRLQALGNPSLLESIRQQQPHLAEAVQDPVRFRQIWDEQMRQQQEISAERQRKIDMLTADPFDVDAQREIEEMIRQEQVAENLQNAMEHNPEVFGRVHMLYIPVEVNSHKVKAFVDSGAQTTVMSPDCAERCGLLRLLDKRYAGIARGIGTAKILGRVHSAMIKIGNAFLACSFTVMEGKDVDLLLGLDMLKKHQACIDLEKGKLIIQGNEVGFLGEADSPKNFEVYNEEPTIDGPAGKKIGAISGTVTESGSSGASSAPATAAQPSSSSGQPASGSGQQPQSTTGPASFPKEDIEQLMGMGFGRGEVIQALEMAGGNVEMAAGLLL
ncbi:hypothetical protein OEA41_003291 [Lepraria neglecta]|uniref:DNA damage-inducible protein 1 n=1 Tax=Lepraria neglecta TaxID=209136 RepID=A0AAE0DI69_9LECA|nr:hypothetical protein OEA41_003291 [Lepraria neglecta]